MTWRLSFVFISHACLRFSERVSQRLGKQGPQQRTDFVTVRQAKLGGFSSQD